MTIVKLAGQDYDIAPPPFGKLRKMISSFNKMVAAGLGSDVALDESAVIIALLIGKTVDEVDAMPISMDEMTAVLNAIPSICGLVQGEKASGGAQVAETASTPSTAT